MIVMSIAGVDPSGGAGVFADLKTFQAIGVYGTGIVTALTAQNPYKFFSTLPVAPDYIEEQIDSVLDEYDIEFIKTGMLYSPEIIKLVGRKVKEYGLKAVVDPVMVATSGGDLTREDIANAMNKYLLPQSILTTPNIAEAEKLTDLKINTKEDVAKWNTVTKGATNSSLWHRYPGGISQLADYPLLSIVQKGGDFTFAKQNGRHTLNSSDLFKVGDEFTWEKYSKFLNKNGEKQELTNKGEVFPYKFVIDYLDEDDATITFTKVK